MVSEDLGKVNSVICSISPHVNDTVQIGSVVINYFEKGWMEQKIGGSCVITHTELK